MKEVKVNRENNHNKEEKKNIGTPATTIIAVIIYFILTLYPPIALFFIKSTLALEAFSAAAAVISVAAFYLLSRSGRRTVSLAITAGALFMLLGSVMCGLIASFIGSVFILVYVILICKNPAYKALALSPAIVSYLLCAALLGSFTLSIAALLHIPAALVLAWCFAKGFDRVGTICRTSFFILLTGGAIAAIAFLSRYGASLDALKGLIDSARTTITDFIANALFTVYNEIGEMVSISMTDATEISRAAVNSAFNLLPALLIVGANLISFSLHSILLTILAPMETDKEKLKRMIMFDMSTVSAAVFVLALIVSAIFSGEELSVWGVTAENIAIILIPGLAFTAIIALRRFIFSKSPSCLGAMSYFLVLALVFYLPAVTLILAALAGAVLIILNAVAAYRAKKKKQ